MAKKYTTKLELTKEDISNYIYAVNSAIDNISSFENPLSFELLNELKNKLTNLNK